MLHVATDALVKQGETLYNGRKPGRATMGEKALGTTGQHRSYERYRVSVEEYRTYRRDGYLVVRGLFDEEDLRELIAHTEELIYGKIEIPGFPPPPPNATMEELEKRLLRIHMLHRHMEIEERFMLHPRLLDVLEALIGPDVLAMQTMLFIKPPGGLGQGYHQDSYYIPTFPDSLCGVWTALERADRENGCLWMVEGSQAEPIYPPEHGYGYGNRELKDIEAVAKVGGAWNDDADMENGLRPVVAKYTGREVPVELEAGEAAFFGGHIIHRSLQNRSATRFRRAFVTHYCNARSFTPWDGGNHQHILARGRTTMPYAQPKFGTPCAANQPEASLAEDCLTPTMMMASKDGMMEHREAMTDPDAHDESHS